MELDQSSHQKNHLSLLVVEKNKDQQLLITHCLRATIPQAQPLFATTAKEAISLLRTSFARSKTVPSLVLLDPFLPDLTKGLGLLIELRAAYPLLPLIILGRQDKQQLVNESYQLGAHSVILKPIDRQGWERHFQALKDYWLDIVSLPR